MSVHDYVVSGTVAGASVDASLRSWSAVQPESAYLTWCPADGGKAEVLTYAELDRRTGRLAARLRAEIAEDAVLGLIPGNDIPSVIAIFAALRAGVPCLLLSPDDPLPRLRAIVGEHPAGAIFRSPFVAEQASSLAVVIPDGESAGPGAASCFPATRPALMFGTSGSTAASKIVVQPHRALTCNAEAVRRHHGLAPNTVVLGGLPIHHVNGVHFTLVAPLHAGAHVVLPQEVFPYRYRELFDTYEPHLASLVPPLLEALLITAPDWKPPARLRYFVSAAAPLTKSLINRVVTAYGVRVIQGYGLTETTNFSTTVPVNLPEGVYREVALDAEIPSAGIALYGNEVEILAPDGTVLGERQQGEICMRGANVMTGYAGRPDLTAEAFAGGWFHSGDLGYWARARDGERYFYITGRSKNIAKVHGHTVSLEEIERALLSLDSVSDAACVAVPDQMSGDRIIALVQPGSADPESADIAEIRAALATLLPAPALPSQWRKVDLIPRTVTGKLRRSQLSGLPGGPEPRLRDQPADATRERSVAEQPELQLRYDALFGYAQAAAGRLTSSPSRPRTARALRIYSAALTLAECHVRTPSGGPWARTAAHDALDALVEDWSLLAAGEADGEDLMRVRPGLWRRLMTEWPMMAYADMAVAALKDRVPHRGPILEVGSGVGNTTARLAACYGERLTWSDRDPVFVRTGEWDGQGRIFDFDAIPPAGFGDFAVIVATNSLHCAADAGRTLRILRDMLVPGGTLVMAEGSSPTRDDGTPWALDMLFSAFDGWWNRSGFRTRPEWIALLAAQGFTDIECARIAAGDDDLGGLVCARRLPD